MIPKNKMSGNLCSVCRTIISSEPGNNLMCPKCQEESIMLLKSVINSATWTEGLYSEDIYLSNEIKGFLIELIYD